MIAGIWRHKSCLDIDIEILKVRYIGPNYTKLKIRIFNRFNGIHYETIQEQKIMKSDFDNWRRIA